MADSLARQWIQKYCIGVAEEYGEHIVKAPKITKRHRVQLLDFLTYPSKEDDIVWANVSDKQHYIVVKFTKEAIAQYNSKNHVINNEGGRITTKKQAIAFISDFRLFLARVPLGNGQGMDTIERLVLEVGYVEVTGADHEGVFGDPKHIETNEDLAEWIKGLRGEGGSTDFLKAAKAARDKENGAPKSAPRDRQTTLSTTHAKISSNPKAVSPSERDPIYAAATNYVEKSRKPKNELLGAYKKSWREISHHIDEYSIIPKDIAVKHLGILSFGLLPKGGQHNHASNDALDITASGYDDEQGPDAEPSITQVHISQAGEVVGQQDDVIRASTPSEWAMSQIEGEGEGRETIGGAEAGGEQPKVRTEASKDVEMHEGSGQHDEEGSERAEAESDSEDDANMADESMNVVYETPPGSLSHSAQAQSSQLQPQSQLPPQSQSRDEHHSPMGQDQEDTDAGIAQANSSLVVETSMSIPFPTPAQRRFGQLATPRNLDSSPTRERDGGHDYKSSPLRLPQSSQVDSNTARDVPLLFERPRRAPVILVPNSDTSGTASQPANSQSQQLSLQLSQAQAEVRPQAQSQSQSQSLSSSIALQYPQTRSQSQSQGQSQLSQPPSFDPDNAFMVHSQSEPHIQPRPGGQVKYPEAKDKVLVPASQPESQTQSDSLYAKSDQDGDASANAAVATAEGAEKDEHRAPQSQTQTESDISKGESQQKSSSDCPSQRLGQEKSIAVPTVPIHADAAAKCSIHEAEAHVSSAVENSSQKGKDKLAGPLAETTNSPVVGRQQSMIQVKQEESQESRTQSSTTQSNSDENVALRPARSVADPNAANEPVSNLTHNDVQDLAQPLTINNTKELRMTIDVDDHMDDDDRAVQAMLKRANASRQVSRSNQAKIAHMPQPSTSTLQGVSSKHTSPLRPHQSPKPDRPTSRSPHKIRQSSSRQIQRQSPPAPTVIVIDSDSDTPPDVPRSSSKAKATSSTDNQDKRTLNRLQSRASESRSKGNLDVDDPEYIIRPTTHDADAWKTASFLRTRDASDTGASNVKGKGKEKERSVASTAMKGDAMDLDVVADNAKAGTSKEHALARKVSSREGSGLGAEVESVSANRSSEKAAKPMKRGRDQSAPVENTPSESKPSLPLPSGSGLMGTNPHASSSKRKADAADMDQPLLDKGSHSESPPPLKRRRSGSKLETTVDLRRTSSTTSSLPLLKGFTMDLNVYKGEDGVKWLNWQDTANILLKIGRLRHKEWVARQHQQKEDL